MSLIQCPDCRKSISPKAPACPHCGRPTAAQTVFVKDTALTRNRGCGDLLLYGFLAVVLLIVGGCVFAVMS